MLALVLVLRPPKDDDAGLMLKEREVARSLRSSQTMNEGASGPSDLATSDAANLDGL